MEREPKIRLRLLPTSSYEGLDTIRRYSNFWTTLFNESPVIVNGGPLSHDYNASSQRMTYLCHRAVATSMLDPPVVSIAIQCTGCPGQQHL